MTNPRPLPKLLIYGGHSIRTSEVRSAPYRREPYVRVELPDLGTVDAKATRWTDSRVLIRWVDSAHDSRSAWVPAEWVNRIDRAESRWRDPYDLGRPLPKNTLRIEQTKDARLLPTHLAIHQPSRKVGVVGHDTGIRKAE